MLKPPAAESSARLKAPSFSPVSVTESQPLSTLPRRDWILLIAMRAVLFVKGFMVSSTSLYNSPAAVAVPEVPRASMAESRRSVSVSYTHLTLPTN